MPTPLSPATLIQIHAIAREVWIEQGCDSEAAEREFCRRMPGPHQLGAFYDLTQLWIDNRTTEPSVVMTTEEARVLGMETD